MNASSFFSNLIRSNLKFQVLSVLIVLFACKRTLGQDDRMRDSLVKKLSHAQTDFDKIIALSGLADFYFLPMIDSSDIYAARAMKIAELNRDRKLIIQVYLRNGNRYVNYSNGISDKLQKGRGYFEDAEKLAKENGLDEELAYSYIGLANVAGQDGDLDKSLNYGNLALSIANMSKNDTLKSYTYFEIGDSYMGGNERLLAFRNYLNALEIAELSRNQGLLKRAYSKLSYFYRQLGEYDKAIDFQMKIMNIDLVHYDAANLMQDYFSAGKAFAAKGNLDMALDMYEHSIVLADSLQFLQFKINPYFSIATMYFDNKDLTKGIDYLKKHPEFADILQKGGLTFFLDEMKGKAYTSIGKFDSAYHYLKQAEPVIEQKTGISSKYDFYTMFAAYYKMKGNYQQAIDYSLKARDIGIKVKDLHFLEASANDLDTLYSRVGDYKTAWYYDREYNHYKDSLQSLSRASDLLKLEVDNDNKRRERQARDEEDNTLRRHNIQYMGFTVGIACLFILLMVSGFFVVSPRTIRALGFFSFIFLFEFIILLADKRIHEWTHGEPWMILLIKILLAAILLPLHHWMEHKLIHYLMSRKKFSASGMPLRDRLFKKNESVPPELE